MREVIFFETGLGDKPVEQFLAGLDAAVRTKAVRTLELLRTQQVVPAVLEKTERGGSVGGTD